jgi:hypothetical protein
MIVEAKLGVQIQTSNPPKPTGVGVIIGGKLIAVIRISEVRRILTQIDHMEVAYEHSFREEKHEGRDL